ncbi:glutamyl-tRNA reductase [Pullulanibacillus pueri]|uniref:Glutamyl-tRNA reductase n=1 Tax=Pullulanibacillus pueri TaxID=1437324 RepID=A0A8J2ZZU6_9BACL|nr:glutamyl-tRNA reductase [Pullulanibacillus pueri]MBM7684240.1 glutamyl-tRNA reductase [Pullulanibacillus pueri]GGH89073.1 glutamyl-tRNA reductase [Pullulanibacillus pueri]
MHILVVGLNHRTAPVEIREQYAIAETALEEALLELRQQKSIFENVILSTCNRTEVYIVSDQLHTGRYYTKAFLSKWFEVDMDTLEQYIFIKEEEKAIEHLFKVACGLDSLVIGETQILGQIRDAFLKAQELKVTGTLFNELFKEAITVAKRSHTEVAINDNAVSVSYAAVELAGKIFGQLDQKQVMIIGAGKMGELAATHMKSHGVNKVTVLNRTMAKAEELAAKFSGRAVSMTELTPTLKDADIIISSTGAPGFVLNKASVEEAIKARKGRPLLMIDIAVPRDIDPEINTIEGVFLYDIDDLEGIVQTNLEERRQEAEQIETLISEQLWAFSEWLQTLGVVPVITALRKKALAIQTETMKSIERKMPNLTDRERKVISKHTKSIINQLLRDPIAKAKEFSGEPNGRKKLETFIGIFGIEDEVKAEQDIQHSLDIAQPLSRQAFKEAPSNS